MYLYIYKTCLLEEKKHLLIFNNIKNKPIFFFHKLKVKYLKKYIGRFLFFVGIFVTVTNLAYYGSGKLKKEISSYTDIRHV